MVEHLLAKEDVASSSLVTRSSLRFGAKAQKGRLPRRRLGGGGRCFKLLFCAPKTTAWQASAVFLESKLPPGCISLQKDQYENIASLHLLSCAGCYGHGTTCTPAASSAIPGGFGVDDGQRLARSGSGG